MASLYQLTCGAEILTINNDNKQEVNIETAEIKCLRSVVGDTRKDQIRNTKIGVELNIQIEFRSQWKHHALLMEAEEF
jgi:hypothetical protein